MARSLAFLMILFWSLQAHASKLEWKEAFLSSPYLVYQGNSYSIESIDSDGFRLLTDLYKGNDTLTQALAAAKQAGLAQTLYTTAAVSCMSFDTVNRNSSGTWLFNGLMFLLFQPLLVPESHVTLLKKSIAAYNTL